MKNRIVILLTLILIMSVLGFYHAHYVVEGVNYVAAWTQQFTAVPIIPPIVPMPWWVNIFIGVLSALFIEDLIMSIKYKLKRRSIRKGRK